MTKLAKFILFFSSYSPLFLMLAIKFKGNDVDLRLFSLGHVQIFMFCLFFAGVAGLSVIIITDKRSSAGPHEITQVQPAGTEAASYLAAYLLPFMTTSEPSGPDLVSYAIFFMMAALIHLHTSVAQINPLLYIMGYRVLKVRTKLGLNAYLVTRRHIQENEVIKASKFGDDMLIERREAKYSTEEEE
ncbi:hypothetical protein [Nocardiopsis quinghaiensis]|uniref:hypothetical protein n=1 Tax=Nocardiopsis quinghaiensis TaxID=464995 RepID=UPI00123A3116|nr:hypothetical protein [Nocardiopsis quinghaiensis]